MTLEIGRAPLSLTDAAVRSAREIGPAPLSRTDVGLPPPRADVGPTPLPRTDVGPAPLSRRDFAVRSPQEIRDDRRAAALRTEVALKVTLVTLTWLVSVSLLLGWGLTGPQRQPGTILLAALLAVVGPFVGAVIATRHGQFRLGGVYVVLTLVMVLPALMVVRAG